VPVYLAQPPYHQVGVERVYVFIGGLGEMIVRKPGYNSWPSRSTPSRIARRKAVSDQVPMPFTHLV
jgi:hypothetical protein